LYAPNQAGRKKVTEARRPPGCGEFEPTSSVTHPQTENWGAENAGTVGSGLSTRFSRRQERQAVIGLVFRLGPVRQRFA